MWYYHVVVFIFVENHTVHLILAITKGDVIPNPAAFPRRVRNLLFHKKRQHIHLLVLLDEDEQQDASEDQRGQIRSWAAQIKRESGG